LIGLPDSDFYLFKRSVWILVITHPTLKSSYCLYFTAFTSAYLIVYKFLTAYHIYLGAKEENLALFTNKWGLNFKHNCSTSLAIAYPYKSQSNHKISY
jgi:hypothetical protein